VKRSVPGQGRNQRLTGDAGQYMIQLRRAVTALAHPDRLARATSNGGRTTRIVGRRGCEAGSRGLRTPVNFSDSPLSQ